MRTAGLRRRRAGEAQGPRAVFRPGPCARLCGWMHRTTPGAKAVAEWRRDVPRQRASCNRGLHRPPRGTDRCEKPRTAKRPPPKAIFRLASGADATRRAAFRAGVPLGRCSPQIRARQAGQHGKSILSVFGNATQTRRRAVATGRDPPGAAAWGGGRDARPFTARRDASPYLHAGNLLLCRPEQSPGRQNAT